MLKYRVNLKLYLVPAEQKLSNQRIIGVVNDIEWKTEDRFPSSTLYKFQLMNEVSPSVV
jgi:hypothetical protein